MKYLVAILALVFYMTDAMAGGDNKRGSASALKRCVNDNCLSNCDIGNTIWGTPGVIQKCEQNKETEHENQGWHFVKQEQKDSACLDGRITKETFNSTSMVWKKGGEDASTKRCWNARCKDGLFFRGNLKDRSIASPLVCMRCDGKNVYKLKTDTIDAGTRTIKLSMEKR